MVAQILARQMVGLPILQKPDAPLFSPVLSVHADLFLFVQALIYLSLRPSNGGAWNLVYNAGSIEKGAFKKKINNGIPLRGLCPVSEDNSLSAVFRVTISLQEVRSNEKRLQGNTRDGSLKTWTNQTRTN